VTSKLIGETLSSPTSMFLASRIQHLPEQEPEILAALAEGLINLIASNTEVSGIAAFDAEYALEIVDEHLA